MIIIIRLFMAKVAYSHGTFPPAICWSICVSVRLSVQCIVAKWLIEYGCSLGRSDGSRDEAGRGSNTTGSKITSAVLFSKTGYYVYSQYLFIKHKYILKNNRQIWHRIFTHMTI